MQSRALLALLALALTGPAIGEAQAAGRGGTTAARKKPKPKTKTKARAKTTTNQRQRKQNGVEQGDALHSRILGIRKARPAQTKARDKSKRVTFLTNRKLVKDRIAKSDKQLAHGQFSDAAGTVTASLSRQNGKFLKAGIKNPTIRERFALWRAARRVKKASRKWAIKRGKQGDADGVRDALNALTKLEAGGRIGAVGRLRNRWFTRRRAANKTVKAANKQMKKRKGANGELARPAAKLIVDVRGNNWRTRKKLRGMKSAAVKLARKYAKQGNPQAASEALTMAQEFGKAGKSEVKKKTMDNIMIDAFTAARRMLVREANKSYKDKDFDGAAAKLAEARRITRSVETKTSRRTRRIQKRLARLLGPRVEKAMAKQERQTLTFSEAAEVASSITKGSKQAYSSGGTSEQVLLSNGSR